MRYRLRRRIEVGICNRPGLDALVVSEALALGLSPAGVHGRETGGRSMKRDVRTAAGEAAGRAYVSQVPYCNGLWYRPSALLSCSRDELRGQLQRMYALLRRAERCNMRRSE
jgi:hypothetical protein